MNKITMSVLLFILVTSFSSCSAIEGIFKAGMWVGILVVVVVVLLILFIVGRSKK